MSEKFKGGLARDKLAPGHRTCAGCGPAIAVRQILDACPKDVVVAEATGCMEVTTTAYPETSWKIPWIHVTFENAPAVASGIESAFRAKGKKTKVIALGGDGGIVDIGFRSLSGALERGHKITVICYDNEAYMNTGVQRSGATPYGASTTTSPAGKMSIGNERPKKDVVHIAAAHHIPYAATASIGYPEDLKRKIQKALEKQPSYVHVHAPCPIGWGYDGAKTVEVAKLAVETGYWQLFEIEGGKEALTYKPAKRKPVADYLKVQKRFRHLKDKEVAEIQKKLEGECKW